MSMYNSYLVVDIAGLLCTYLSNEALALVYRDAIVLCVHICTDRPWIANRFYELKNKGRHNFYGKLSWQRRAFNVDVLVFIVKQSSSCSRRLNDHSHRFIVCC